MTPTLHHALQLPDLSRVHDADGAKPAVFGPAWLRRAILFFGGIVFYAFWRIEFTFLVLFTAFVDWYGGLRRRYLPRPNQEAQKHAWMTLSLVMNLTVLGFFSSTSTLSLGRHRASWEPCSAGTSEMDLPFKIILPLGISFYIVSIRSATSLTCTAGSCPRSRSTPSSSPAVMFWTQLVAGADPAGCMRSSRSLRTTGLPHQGREVTYALEEILQGFFKKIVLADMIVRRSWTADLPLSRSSSLACSMCGCWRSRSVSRFTSTSRDTRRSRWALGRVLMGFKFPPNFNLAIPGDLAARLLALRWHISLSTWIRDYLYLPLAGHHVPRERTKGCGLRTPRGAGPGSQLEARRSVALFLDVVHHVAASGTAPTGRSRSGECGTRPWYGCTA